MGPSEVSPLADDPPEPFEGVWRIVGVIDAPVEWNPTEDSDLFQIWFGESYPQDRLEPSRAEIDFSLIYLGINSSHWTFETLGEFYYPYYPYPQYFEPKMWWWSHPDQGYPLFRKTWVQGYKWVEFGGGGHLVLADEDWSFNPNNYEDGIPRPDWKYVNVESYYWRWNTVYLDLR